MKIEQTVVQTVEPTPELRTAIIDYQQAAWVLRKAEAQIEKDKAAVAAALEGTGETHIVVDGIPVTWVFPVRSTLDKKKLLAQGVTMAQIEAATTTEPGKPYLKITLPKETV
jgi:hypothetical protein